MKCDSVQKLPRFSRGKTLINSHCSFTMNTTSTDLPELARSSGLSGRSVNFTENIPIPKETVAEADDTVVGDNTDNKRKENDQNICNKNKKLAMSESL